MIPGRLTCVLLLVRDYCLESALVHSLGPNVKPVFFKLLIRHVRSYVSLFTLQPLFCPLTKFRVPVECHPGRMHVKACAHLSCVTLKIV